MATIRPNGASVELFYVHADHLNTPRRISRPSDNVVVWQWGSDPFGAAAANEDPDGDTQAFVYGLRFPGQYMDIETGLYYNYFRDYDPSVGRYVQSDPIGLRGGLNTYLYADANPVSKSDSTGENAAAAVRGAWWAGTRIGGAINFGIEAALGIRLGSAIYDICNSEADDEAERCKKIEEDCFEECEPQLGVGGRTNQGWPYRNCWVRCMKRNGCYKGDSPIE